MPGLHRWDHLVERRLNERDWDAVERRGGSWILWFDMDTFNIFDTCYGRLWILACAEFSGI